MINTEFEPYYVYAINEICEFIKENMLLQYNNNRDALLLLHDYCDERYDEEYLPLPYNRLLSFNEEVLAELINADFLYDFRPMC